MSKTILITGATGTVGRPLARALARSNDLDVRALVRDPDRAADLDGVALIRGSFEDAASLDAALAGVDTAVLITAPGPAAADQAKAVIDRAAAAGVRKIVRLSAIKASADGPTANTRSHARTEADLAASGLTYVALRPQLFMQNLLMGGAAIAAGQLISAIGGGRVGMIDTRDVSDALAAAVVGDDFDGQTLELTGPESISQPQIAASLAAALGRPVEVVAIEPEAAGEAARDFVGDWMAGVITDYMRAYRDGFGDFVTGAVESLTKRPPRDIDAFAAEVVAPALAAAR
jgi:uncharacterized protein YbjT (DUF2867 family)